MRCTAGAHEGSASVSLDRTQGTWPFLPNEFLKSAMIASSDLPIKHLILKHHRLAGLPENFSYLSTFLPQSLTTLDLSFNLFVSLPVVVCQLRELRELFLNNNQIAHMPHQLSNLVHLQTLHLQFNKLEALPVAVCGVKSLIRLNLDNNSISLVPTEVSELVQIQELYLSWNQLDSLPPSITELASLKELHLSNNSLRRLPDSLRGLTSLQQLHLANNKLRFLPKSIVNLERLSGLTLSGNKLKFPPLSACRDGVSGLKAYMKEKLHSSSGVWTHPDGAELSVSVNLYCNDSEEEEEEEEGEGSGAETPFEDMDEDV